MRILHKIDERLVLFFGLVGAGLFLAVGPRLYPTFGLRLDFTRGDAVRRAEAIASSWSLESKVPNVLVNLRVDRSQIGYLQKTFGQARANELARDSVPAFTWQVKWTKGPSSRRDRFANEEEALQAVTDRLGERLTVGLDTHGLLVSFSRPDDNASRESPCPLPDSSLAIRKARRFLARVALVDTTGLLSVSEKHFPESIQSREGQVTAVWREKRLVAGERVFHVVVVSTSGIVRYRRLYVPPVRFRLPPESPQQNIPQLIGLLTLVVLVFVTGVRRLKADRMDLSSTVGLAVVVGLATMASVYTAVRLGTNVSLLNVVVSVVFATLFNVAAVVFLAAVTDSLARDVWPEKVLSFAAVLRGRAVNRYVGRSVVIGLSWAGVGLGSIVLFDLLAAKMGGGIFLMSALVGPFSVESPSIFVVSGALALVLTVELAYRGFILSLLRRFVQKQAWLLAAGFVVGALGQGTVTSVTMVPHVAEVLRTGLYGMVLTAVFLQADLLATVVASLGQYLLVGGAVLFASGLRFSGVEIGLVLLALGILGVAGLQRDVPPERLAELEPTYLRRLAERERIRRELEIARHVQQTFLPKTTPKVPGLDIASRCIPAAEVGGDYYDFFQLGPGRLGVAIGDVSGKGIGAAFYMTLTKGFLRAMARQYDSPKDVLVRVNRLFYENAERGRFISMIYGVFDVEKGEFTFARAGHNPLLLLRARSAETGAMPVAPRGLALGLTGTRIFEEVTEESRVRISPGDIFVLYTDGFTEAMDRAENEFGETRLQTLLREIDPHLTAAQLLQVVYQEVQDFTGRQRQHDDMSLIVVKVLGKNSVA